MKTGEVFKNPPQIYRGTDFWMLNDELTDDEIRFQVKEFADKGVGSFIARTYVGLRTDYPGPKWKHQIRVMLEEATKYGLKVTLQAKRMPGGVKDLPKKYVLGALECLTYKELNDKNYPYGGAFSKTLSRYNEYYIVKHTTGDPEKAGGTLNMYSEEACEYYVNECYGDMWEEFRPYYGNTVFTMWVDEPNYSNETLPWPDNLPDVFKERWGYDITAKTYLLFFNVENYKEVRYHYRVTLQKMMEEAYFTHIRDWCQRNGVSFSGHLMNEDGLLSQILRAGAVMPYYKYFDIPGIDILEADMPWRYGAIKEPHPREDLGRDEHTGEYYTPMSTLGQYTTPLQCTSAAHQAGKEHMLCEMYGVTTNNFTLRDQRRMFDHFAALGINHRCVHAYFYNLHGRAKRAFPAQVNYYQPYWEKYRPMTDYVARVSWFISCGKPVRDVLLIHPLETAYMLFEGIKNGVEKNDLLDDYDRRYFHLVRALCGMQCQFEYGDEATIGDWGEAQDGRFSVGEMSYKTVVLPYLDVIRKSTLQKLSEYRKKGGKVYILGTLPTRLDGCEDRNLAQKLLDMGCVFCEHRKELLDLLALENTDFSISCTSDITPILVNHRADENADYFFLMNDDCADDRELKLTLKGERSLFSYDAFTAEVTPYSGEYKNGETVFTVKLEAGSSKMIQARKSAFKQVENPSGEYRVRAVSDDWTLQRNDPNVMLLEFCRYKREEWRDFSEKTYPAITIGEMLEREEYSGKITLQFEFCAKQSVKPRLVVEDAALSEITFNGKPVNNRPVGHYVAHAFEILELPEACKAGKNTVEITRRFFPKAKMKGLDSDQTCVDLESIYLIGDFGVFSRPEPAVNGTLRYSRYFTLDRETPKAGKDITKEGYPFYTGTMSFIKDMEVSEKDLQSAKVLFRFEEFNGCVAEVFVNEQSAGCVFWAPYEIDLKPFLKPGANRVRVEVTNCLRNLLGPYHRVAGEIGNLWGGYDAPNLPWSGNRPDDPEWYEHREFDTRVWTDDYFLMPFGFGKAELRFYE